jgi:uncharacterized protein YdiU (UPF0061 family)
MAFTPQQAILELGPAFYDPVTAARFPECIPRFLNGRWAERVGLDLGEEQWTRHVCRFEPLPDNLEQPLALRYHGHQFRNYNPNIGDGRGFLHAQMLDGENRVLDLGTKGSGQTPYSRDGDGRLTLKGAVREILATEMLEALGVYTSKTFSVIETGEALWRGDEPSPTRSAVMVRLSHGHIRIGTFQRLLALEEREHMEALVAYCLETFPGNLPPEDAPGRDEPAVILLHQVVERMADLAASWMVAGFVHGVLNTDNMNISGESFDYGPWRWLPRWDPRFTAAYFDHSGLYAFGRQPEAVLWNCGQLAIALSMLTTTEPLVAALDRFAPLYQQAMSRRFTWRLGVVPQGQEQDSALIQAAEQAMLARGEAPEQFFFRHRGGRDDRQNAGQDRFGELLDTYAPAAETSDPFWQQALPPSTLIDEVERIWSAIDQHDDWSALHARVAEIRELGRQLGTAPTPAGHKSEG